MITVPFLTLLSISALSNFIPCVLGMVGGNATLPYAYPYLVSVRKHHVHICTGTLYQGSFILTEAFCLVNVRAKQLTVVAREHNIDCEEGYEEVRAVNQIIVHPQFNHLKVGGKDIAILLLKTPFENGDNILSATLPPPGYTYPDTAILVGWGATSTGTVVSHPYQVNLTSVLKADCERVYSGFFYIGMGKEAMCYGNTKEKSGCEDSGAPLLCGDNKEYVCGIFNVALVCGQENHPGIFQNLVDHEDFINRTITQIGGRMLPVTASKDPPGMEITTCGGYYETPNGSIKLQSLSATQKCHFALKIPKTDIILELKESTLLKTDELIVTRFCKGNPCERINMHNKLGWEEKIKTSLVMVTVTISSENPSQVRGFTLNFNSSGGETYIPNLTGFTVLNTSSSGTYNHPAPKGGKYANDEFHLIVLDSPKEKDKNTRVQMTKVDLEKGNKQEKCVYDAVTVYELDKDGYSRVTRVCGTKPPNPFNFKSGFGIISMISDNDTVGQGFTFDYSS